ncbi:MAG TPA: hypothetical protein VJ579_01435 [Candidatus Paceibacterota bacterium]|nr:hypothetical protein [Candidatus Paceibacterota bacterium]
MSMFNSPQQNNTPREREFPIWFYLIAAAIVSIICLALFYLAIKPAIDQKRAYTLGSTVGHKAFTARLLGHDNEIIGIDEEKTFTLFVYYTGSVTYYAGGRGGDTKNIRTQGGDGNYDIAKFKRQIAELEAKGMKLDESSVTMERFPDGMFIVGKLNKK